MISCVMVCVNYGDFLKITLPLNKSHFDEIIVVTSHNDDITKKICSENSIRYVETNRMYESENDAFNKGKAINEGIKNLKHNDWLVITDADMVFPDDTKKILNSIDNKNNIYGISRYICPTKNEFDDYYKTKTIPNNWKHQKKLINIGVGFFQMANFNCDIMKNKTKNSSWYSEKWGHCGRSDRSFWRSWPDSNRSVIKNLFGIHLGDDGMATNWFGRKSRLFE